MKYLKQLIFLYLFTSSLISCKENSKVSSLNRAQLMELHDEAMGKMETIYNLKKKLVKLNDTTNNSVIRHQASLLLNKLDQSDEAMMQWMRNYKEPDSSFTVETAEKYYAKQLIKMDSINKMIDASIDASHNLTKLYESHP